MEKLVRLSSGIGLLLLVPLSVGVHAAISEPTGSVKGRAPVANSVVISNQSRPGVQPRVGNVLQVGYSFSDVDGDAQSGTTVQWKRGTATVGTASTYATQTADANQSLRVEVMPQTDPATTDPASGVPRASTAVTVAAAGAAVGIGNFLVPTTATYTRNQAISHCSQRGARLPSSSELQQLFLERTSATAIGQTNYEMCDVYGWPLDAMCGGVGGGNYGYWSFDNPVTFVVMHRGSTSGGDVSYQRYVACVR